MIDWNTNDRMFVLNRINSSVYCGLAHSWCFQRLIARSENKQNKYTKMAGTKPIFFYDKRSPPVRSIFLLIEALKIDIELKEINLFAGEHLSPAFVAVRIHLTIFKSFGQLQSLVDCRSIHSTPYPHWRMVTWCWMTAIPFWFIWRRNTERIHHYGRRAHNGSRFWTSYSTAERTCSDGTVMPL